MDALLNLWKPSSSLASLQAFYDTIEQHMRALSSLGKTSESYETMLTPSVLNKLPVEVKKHMARDHSGFEWSINDVMSGLLREIRILDMSQQHSGTPSMRDSTPPPTASFHTHTDRASHSRSSSQQRKQPVCTFCKGNHKANNCNLIVDPKERLAIVKRDNLCFNCLGQHKASQCTSRFSCRECKKRHHSSLCRCFPADSKSPQSNSPPLPANQPLTTEQTSSLTTLNSTPPPLPYIPMCAC